MPERISAGGLEINGLETRSLEELLSLKENRTELDSLLKEAYDGIEKDFYSAEAGKLRAENYEKAVASLIEGLEGLRKLSQEAAECAGTAAFKDKMGHLGQEERERVLEILDTANKSIMESDVKEIAGFLFPETGGWEAEFAAKNLSSLNRHLEYSGRFYRSLFETVSFNLLKLGN